MWSFFCARNKSWANNVDFLKGMENLPDDSTFLNHTRQTRKKESRIKKGFAHILQYKDASFRTNIEKYKKERKEGKIFGRTK